LQGTRLGQTGSATFTFTWTPPSTSVGQIDIYVAGNAANGNSLPTGDNIYLANYTLSPPPGGAAPSISAGGIVNAAGFQSTIAPGSWVAITGTNLCGTTRTWNAGDFTNNGTAEPQKLEDVTITMGGLPAYVYYVSPTQINVQAPALPPGPVSVTVNNANGVSAAVTATVAAESPAFFLWSGKYAVATRPDFTYVGPPGLFSSVTTTPARPGDTVILWGTGFGPTTPAVPPGTLTPSTSATVNDPVTVTVGGLSAEYDGGAMTSGEAGLYQIVIKIPPSAPNGDLPILASIDGVQSPAGVFITVQQ
ncbi:MAG TPA: choice-of-anchor V domain-containing protein, partial [Bryobacteraceae bacterium]|nr:choice-of-anchor V domain-containing protein [Bryobacteraceae bacterium]